MKETLNKIISNNLKPYIIAEMACSHDGSFEKAKSLINSAAISGADAIQLQLFRTNDTVTPKHQVFETLKRIEFSEDQWRELIYESKKINIDVWICAYDFKSLEFALNFDVNGIKINSSDLSNLQMLELLSNYKNLPVTLGTGSSTIEEITNAIDVFKNSEDRLILVHGVQNFPTITKNLNLSRISYLKKIFPNFLIGYADHTKGGTQFSLEVDLIALGLGVRLIEKHINMSRSHKGIDHEAALEPFEFKQFVKKINKGFDALGLSIDNTKFSESDIRYRKFQKKSIVFSTNLNKGHVLKYSDLKILRNKSVGLDPSKLDFFIGKKLLTNVKAYQNLKKSFVIN